MTAAGSPPVAGRAHRTQRTIAAPVARVFAASSTPDLLARWWGPEGFSNTFQTFDFRERGEWRFTMHGPDGKAYLNESRFLEIAGNERVVIEHLSDHHFVLTITLSARGSATVVGWQQVFDTSEHFREIEAFVSRANEQNLDRLQALLARGQPDA